MNIFFLCPGCIYSAATFVTIDPFLKTKVEKRCMISYDGSKA